MGAELQFALASPRDFRAAKTVLKKKDWQAFERRVGVVPGIAWRFVIVGGFLDEFVARGGLVELTEEESIFMNRTISVDGRDSAYVFWRLPDPVVEWLATSSSTEIESGVARAQAAGFERGHIDQLRDVARQAVSDRKDVYAFVFVA